MRSSSPLSTIWNNLLLIDHSSLVGCFYAKFTFLTFLLVFVSFSVHHKLALMLVYWFLFFVLLDKFYKYFFLYLDIPQEFGIIDFKYKAQFFHPVLFFKIASNGAVNAFGFSATPAILSLCD